MHVLALCVITYIVTQIEEAELPYPSTATPDGEREKEGSSPELPHKERNMLDIKWGSLHQKKTTQVKTVCVCVCVFERGRVYEDREI